MTYPRIFVAGTFDGLHKGHAFILTRAFKLGKNVTIGLTSDLFIKKFKISNFKLKIRDYESRKKDLMEWLKKKHLSADIVPIDDPYEPAASFPSGGALLVTPDNKHRGEEINAIRKKRNLVKFDLIQIPLIKAQDKLPISSTRIRKGEIDTEGRLILPDNLRSELQKPLGKIVKTVPRRKADYIITVGDVTAKTFLEAGVRPAQIIIDNKVERKRYGGLKKFRAIFANSTKVISGPGYISQSAIRAIKKSKVLEVNGEEDLLALPAVIYAPIGVFVYYGQPGEGMVEIRVTKELKKKAASLLSQFLVKS